MCASDHTPQRGIGTGMVNPLAWINFVKDARRKPGVYHKCTVSLPYFNKIAFHQDKQVGR